MGREDPQLKLRLSEDLKSRISEAAQQNGRSVNAEIVARLTQTFDGEEEIWAEVHRLSETIDDLLKRFAKIEPEVKTMWSHYDGGNFGRGA